MSNWIKWDGEGDCPIERGTLIDVKYRGGRSSSNVKAMLPPNHQDNISKMTAEDWSHDYVSDDIVAYRLVGNKK